MKKESVLMKKKTNYTKENLAEFSQKKNSKNIKKEIKRINAQDIEEKRKIR